MKMNLEKAFRSRFPLSETDTQWSDDDDESDYELDDVHEDFLSDDDDDDDDKSDGESSTATSEESDGEAMPDIESFSVIDDETDFDGGNEATNVISSTVSQFLPEMNNDLYSLLCYINELLSRLRALVKFIRNSSLIYSYVRDKMATVSGVKELVCDVRVRWNSTWLMLQRLLIHKDVINAIASSPDRISGLHKDQKAKLKSLVLSHNDWEMIVVVHEILHPFVIATKILSGQSYPTMAAAQYVTRKLETFLSDNADDSSIVMTLKQSLRFRFKMYFQEKAPYHQKECFLVSFI